MKEYAAKARFLKEEYEKERGQEEELYRVKEYAAKARFLKEEYEKRMEQGAPAPTPAPPTVTEQITIGVPSAGEVQRLAEDVQSREKTLEELAQAAQSPQQRAAYEEYYRETYLPAYGRYKAVYDPYVEERERTKEQEWEKFARELGEVGLTKSEIATIKANLEYIRTSSKYETPEERQRAWEEYLKPWEYIITTRAEKRAVAVPLKKPFSLQLMEAAHTFPEKYEKRTAGLGPLIMGFPKPIFDIGFPQVSTTKAIGATAMGGAAIVGTFEELGMSLAGLFKPEAVAGYAPPPSPIAIALIPEYREKYWPGAVVAAPVIFPLEAKAIGAAIAPVAKGIKGAFHLAALKLPKGVQLELITKQQRIARWLGLPEKYVKVRPPVFVGKTRDVWMKAVTGGGKGYAEVGAGFKEIFKPAPRWLVPKWMEKLMPSWFRTKYYAAQAIRRAAKPEWMPKSAYEALVKSAAEYTFNWKGPMLTQTFRGVTSGSKKVIASAMVQQSERFALEVGMHSPTIAGVSSELAQISSRMVPAPFVFIDTLASDFAKAAAGIGAGLGSKAWGISTRFGEGAKLGMPTAPAWGIPEIPEYEWLEMQEELTEEIGGSAEEAGTEIDEAMRQAQGQDLGQAQSQAHELEQAWAQMSSEIEKQMTGQAPAQTSAQALKQVQAQLTKTMQAQQLQTQMQMPTRWPWGFPLFPFDEEVRGRPHRRAPSRRLREEERLRIWKLGKIEKMFEPIKFKEPKFAPARVRGARERRQPKDTMTAEMNRLARVFGKSKGRQKNRRRR